MNPVPVAPILPGVPCGPVAPTAPPPVELIVISSVDSSTEKVIPVPGSKSTSLLAEPSLN